MKKLWTLLVVFVMAIIPAFAQEAEITVNPPQAASAVFALKGNATTGNKWTAVLLTDGVAHLTNPDGEYTVDEADEGMTGVGGTHRFELVADAPGETVIIFRYGRAWEGSTAQTLQYLVTVLEDGTMQVSEAAVLTGTVTEIDEENHLAFIKTENDEVLARFPEDMMLPVQDEELNIWYNGIMTLSLPAQINVIGWETIPNENAR